MRIDGKHFFSAVLLTANKSHKQSTGLTPIHILKNAPIEVVLENAIMAQVVPAVVEQVRITSARGGGTSFLDVSVGAVGKAQHELFVLFVEFVFAGQEFQATLLARFRRI